MAGNRMDFTIRSTADGPMIVGMRLTELLADCGVWLLTGKSKSFTASNDNGRTSGDTNVPAPKPTA